MRILFLALLSWCHAVVATADELTIAVGETGFEPYQIRNGDQFSGIDVDVALEAMRRAGIAHRLVILPWKRTLATVRSGDTGGGLSAFSTPERREYAAFHSFPLHITVVSAFARKRADIRFAGVESLANYRVGINLGFSMSESLDAAVRRLGVQVEEAEDTRTNINKLIRGRIELFINNNTVTYYLAGRMSPPAAVIALEPPLNSGAGAYLMISKAAHGARAASMAGRIDEAMLEMHADGELARIYARYVGDAAEAAVRQLKAFSERENGNPSH